MKFKFETGEVIECFDEGIAKILRADKRYKEVVTDKVVTDEEKPVKKTAKGGNSNGKV